MENRGEDYTAYGEEPCGPVFVKDECGEGKVIFYSYRTTINTYRICWILDDAKVFFFDSCEVKCWNTRFYKEETELGELPPGDVATGCRICLLRDDMGLTGFILLVLPNDLLSIRPDREYDNRGACKGHNHGKVVVKRTEVVQWIGHEDK